MGWCEKIVEQNWSISGCQFTRRLVIADLRSSPSAGRLRRDIHPKNLLAPYRTARSYAGALYLALGYRRGPKRLPTLARRWFTERISQALPRCWCTCRMWAQESPTRFIRLRPMRHTHMISSCLERRSRMQEERSTTRIGCQLSLAELSAGWKYPWAKTGPRRLAHHLGQAWTPSCRRDGGAKRSSALQKKRRSVLRDYFTDNRRRAGDQVEQQLKTFGSMRIAPAS